ncbi:hypothetical protein BU14_0292s0023 [Porphyra umbilicalis]|uniref:Uncharacterized protein n=1 Tax=Porphyra umbilicalis TaxID=2786 RepID=A0A1X6P0I0_PORUM|nr:hypothetical protein BU14_0292s0023 [Porphyra umbilicalis]|eukprot:OSX74381.1 hypothetical protein BU14_0292s0023 [Porphyra umbilicalis]
MPQQRRPCLPPLPLWRRHHSRCRCRRRGAPLCPPPRASAAAGGGRRAAGGGRRRRPPPPPPSPSTAAGAHLSPWTAVGEPLLSVRGRGHSASPLPPPPPPPPPPLRPARRARWRGRGRGRGSPRRPRSRPTPPAPPPPPRPNRHASSANPLLRAATAVGAAALRAGDATARSLAEARHLTWPPLDNVVKIAVLVSLSLVGSVGFVYVVDGVLMGLFSRLFGLRYPGGGGDGGVGGGGGGGHRRQ